MESKLKNVESKSYNKGKVNAQLWKAELNTKKKIQRKLNEARKAYKNYILEYHLNNHSIRSIKNALYQGKLLLDRYEVHQEYFTLEDVLSLGEEF